MIRDHNHDLLHSKEHNDNHGLSESVHINIFFQYKIKNHVLCLNPLVFLFPKTFELGLFWFSNSLVLSVPDDGYSINASCALILISTILLRQGSGYHTGHLYTKMLISKIYNDSILIHFSLGKTLLFILQMNVIIVHGCMRVSRRKTDLDQ